jgi:hypothetical protein
LYYFLDNFRLFHYGFNDFWFFLCYWLNWFGLFWFWLDCFRCCWLYDFNRSNNDFFFLD